MHPSRRRLLGILGTLGVGTLAGCNDSAVDTDDPPAETGTPTLTPTTTLAPAPTDTRTPTDGSTPTTTRTPPPTDTPTDRSTPTDTPIEYQQRKFAAADGDGEDQFGLSVALSGDGTTALVGALWDEDPNGRAAGSAYVFTRDGGEWSQEAKLVADDGDSGDAFGNSVVLSSDGTTALVGAFIDEDPNGGDAGSVYVFTRDGGEWSQSAELAAEDGDDTNRFGNSVALSDDGTTALLGALTDEDPNGTEAGSAYVFTRDGGEWSQSAKLAADDGDSGDWFGWSVALSSDGTTALVGALRDEDPNGAEAGSAYVFE
jgi:hypothetical protein